MKEFGNTLKPSTAKRKGVETENIWISWLKDKWGLVNVERRRLNGTEDKGDVAGWVKQNGSHNVVVEIKSGAKLSIPEWLGELKEEKKNAKGDLGFIAVRPKGKPNAEDWFIIMPATEFMQLTREAGYLHD